jgi:hypothetical protein
VVQVIYSYPLFYAPYDIIALVIPFIFTVIIGISLTRILNSEKIRLIQAIKNQINLQTNLSKANVNRSIEDSKISEEERIFNLAKYYQILRYQRYLICPVLLDHLGVSDLRKIKQELDLTSIMYLGNDRHGAIFQPISSTAIRYGIQSQDNNKSFSVAGGG